MILHPKHKRMASLICFGAAKDHLLLCMQSTRPPPERIKDHLLLCADSCVADSCVGEYFESFMVEMLHSRVEMLHSRECIGIRHLHLAFVSVRGSGQPHQPAKAPSAKHRSRTLFTRSSIHSPQTTAAHTAVKPTFW